MKQHITKEQWDELSKEWDNVCEKHDWPLKGKCIWCIAEESDNLTHAHLEYLSKYGG